MVWISDQDASCTPPCGGFSGPEEEIHLAWEDLQIPQEQLESVTREKDI